MADEPDILRPLEFHMTLRSGRVSLTFPAALNATEFLVLERWVSLALEIGRDCVAANQPPVPPEAP